ncbi:MAG TPA: VWA domain-containing protein [Bryobacteraceae bacterium]|nr:VWA domain-containing protein [Bryobacteraceae bacterium]
MRSVRTGVAIAALAGAAVLYAAQAVETFRTGARLVEITVIARDSEGRAITDLKPDDFTLRVDGKPGKIVFFAREGGPASSEHAALPRNAFSNRVATPTTPHAITVILLDALNTRFEHFSFATEQFKRYLRESARPRDRLNVFVLGHRLRVVQDFTGYPAQVAESVLRSAAIDAAKETDALFGSLLAANVDGVLEVGDVYAEYDIMRRYEATRAAFETMAVNFKDVPGRKNLVWLSESFPLVSDKRSEISDRDRQLWANLSRADVAIYPIRAEGVLPDPGYAPEQALPPTGIGGGGGDWFGAATVAHRSGGRVYQNRNDLSNSIRSAVNDTQILYTLAFYAEPVGKPGRFHSIKLRVKRPHVELQHRPGYFDEDAKPAAQDDKARFRGAVASPVDARALPVDARIATGKKPNALAVTVKTLLEGYAPGETARYRILFVQKGETGRQFRGIDDMLELELDGAEYRRLLHDGVVYSREIERLPEATELRIVVENRSSGNIGSLTVPYGELRLP